LRFCFINRKVRSERNEENAKIGCSLVHHHQPPTINHQLKNSSTVNDPPFRIPKTILRVTFFLLLPVETKFAPESPYTKKYCI
jgi:hypothetical protein